MYYKIIQKIQKFYYFPGRIRKNKYFFSNNVKKCSFFEKKITVIKTTIISNMYIFPYTYFEYVQTKFSCGYVTRFTFYERS
jgi:hypothetical protein